MAVKLDDLPPSTSKYWKDADTYSIEMKKPPKCQHQWQQVKGTEAECVNCHAGLFLNAGDEIRNKHIYRKKKLVI